MKVKSIKSLAKSLGILSATLAAACFAANSIAATTLYTGYDVGSGESVRLGSFANSTAARTSFLSGLNGVGTESFESFNDGAVGPLVVDFGVAGTATLGGDGSVRSTAAGATNGVGRYATDGNKYWDATNSFNIAFSAPVSAFGFMGVDIGDYSGQVTVTTTGGLNQVFNVGNPTNTPGGGVLFWGLISTTDTFAGITFGNTSAGHDFFAFDQMTVGSLKQVVTGVPEPESYALMLAGLGLIGAATRRRKASNA